MGTSRIRCRRRPRTAGLSCRGGCVRSSDASDDRLKTLPPAPTQLGAQAPGLEGLPSLLRQVLLPSTDRGAQGRGGRLGGGRWGRGCRRRGHEDPPRCGGLPALGRRPHGYQSGRDNTARPSPRLPLGGRHPDPGDRDPPAPAPPHQPIRHRSRCRVHCCPAPRAALSRELPQDRKVARVSGLWRVHGGSLTHRRPQPRPHSCTFSHISLRHRSGPHRHATLAPPGRRRRESPDPGDVAENVYEV